MIDKWEKRERKVKARQNIKEYSKPFKKELRKDSKSKKILSKIKKRLQQEENNFEDREDNAWEY